MAGGLHLWRPRHLARLQRSHLGHSGGGVFNKQDYSVHGVHDGAEQVGLGRGQGRGKWSNGTFSTYDYTRMGHY